MAQSLVELFSNDIPRRYISDPYYTQKLEDELKLKSEINPDILFFHIKYTNNLFDHSLADSARKYKAISDKLEKETFDSFNKWIDTQVELIDKSKDLKIIRNTIKDILIKNKIESGKTYAPSVIAPSVIPNIDIKEIINNELYKNQIDYFVYKLHQQDKNLTYTDSIDYHTQRVRQEKAIIEDLYLMIQNAIDSTITLRVIKSFDLFSYWKYYITINEEAFNPLNLYIDVVKKYFMTTKGAGFYVSLKYLPIYKPGFFTTVFTDSKTFNDTEYDIENSLDWEMDFSDIFGIEFGYTYFLSDYSTPFTSITFDLGIGISTDRKQSKNQDNDLYTKGQPGADYYERILADSNYFNINNLTVVNLGVNTPVYDIPGILEVSTGIEFNYTRIDLDYYTKYHWFQRYSYVYHTVLGPTILWEANSWYSELIKTSMTINDININLPIVVLNLTIPTIPTASVDLTISPRYGKMRVLYRF